MPIHFLKTFRKSFAASFVETKFSIWLESQLSDRSVVKRPMTQFVFEQVGRLRGMNDGIRKRSVVALRRFVNRAFGSVVFQFGVTWMDWGPEKAMA